MISAKKEWIQRRVRCGRSGVENCKRIPKRSVTREVLGKSHHFKPFAEGDNVCRHVDNFG